MLKVLLVLTRTIVWKLWLFYEKFYYLRAVMIHHFQRKTLTRLKSMKKRKIQILTLKLNILHSQTLNLTPGPLLPAWADSCPHEAWGLEVLGPKHLQWRTVESPEDRWWRTNCPLGCCVQSPWWPQCPGSRWSWRTSPSWRRSPTASNGHCLTSGPDQVQDPGCVTCPLDPQMLMLFTNLFLVTVPWFQRLNNKYWRQ